jgi:hypothetical protein
VAIDRVDIVRWGSVESDSRFDSVVASLRDAFPGLRVGVWHPHWWPREVERVVSFSLARWCAEDFDPMETDDALREAAARGTFVLRIEDVEQRGAFAAEQVLTRCQRYIDLRNAQSRGDAFDEVLTRHRALHDVSKPLVRADLEHAVDTWRWVLRLDPNAGTAVQIAALFHDIERLASEADVRIEHRADDYEQFKLAHARQGGVLTEQALRDIPLDAGVLDRAVQLVSAHEKPAGDPDLALLNDADALSFVSLNVSGFVRYYGVPHTRKKIAYTLRRMRPSARWRIDRIRVRNDLLSMIRAERAALEPTSWFAGASPNGQEPS